MKPLMYFASKEMCEVVVRLFFQCVDLQLFFFLRLSYKYLTVVLPVNPLC